MIAQAEITATWADPAFGIAIYHGDCLDVFTAMPGGCIDAVVTGRCWPGRMKGRRNE